MTNTREERVASAMGDIMPTNLGRMTPWAKRPEEERELYRELARAAIAALEPSPDVWEAIETAPRDGTPVLLFGRYEDVSVCEWRNGTWACVADGQHAIRYQSDFGTEYIDFEMPTHWAKLPDPPKVTVEPQGDSR